MTEYADRISLAAGDELKLEFHTSERQKYIQRAVVEEMIGKGTSCLTYIVRLFTDETSSVRMIMKEFYPVSEKGKFEIRRTGTKLLVSEETKNSVEYRNMQKAFWRAYQLQTNLSDSAAMEVMVRPYHMTKYGDSFYILSDMHLGKIVTQSKLQSLSDKLWLMYRTAEAIHLLNEQGYLYIDLNPSNVLWIPSQQSVKLFDVDSIVPWNNLDSVHSIRATYPYIPPEMEELNEWFDVNKTAFLKPSWDVYCLGLIFFQLIFGRMPTDEDLQTGYGSEYEINQILRQQGYENHAAEQLMRKILFRALNRKFRIRYPSSMEMCKDLNQLKKMLDAEEFIPKKEYANANYMIQSYHILDKWPVYEAALNENGQEVLDVAICGKQPIREYLFKAVFSCVHMPGKKLRIRLYAEDAVEFMENMKKENPALVRTIHIYYEDKCVWNETDRVTAGPEICKEPMAEIRLYKKSREDMLANNARFMKKIKSKYLLLLWDGTDDKMQLEQIVPKGTIMPAINFNKTFCYDEKLFGTKIMEWAMNVHTFYCRGTYERMPREKIRESFEKDVYSLDSSMRSALSIRYKLGTLGIGKECSKPGEEFYRRVFAMDEEQSEKIIGMLTGLEHLSWSAFMVINGWDTPTDAEIEQYSFVGDNDFKDKKHKLHPCMVAARSENVLKLLDKKEWNKKDLSRTLPKELDDLDLTSLKLHRMAGKKMKKIRPEIKQMFEKLERQIRNYENERLRESFQWLVSVNDRVFAGESNAEIVWNQAMEQLSQICDEVCKYNQEIHDSLKELDRRMKVVHEYNAYHNYKQSDEDIIRGIPGILSDNCIQTIIRPYLPGKNNHWKNILAALFLEPKELFFISTDDEEVDIEFYREFLRFRGSGTKVLLSRLEDITQVKDGTIIDITGLDEDNINWICSYDGLSGRQRVAVANRKLVGIDNPMIEMYARKIHLTVEEIFYLFEVYMDSDKKDNPVLGLSSRYHGIWNTYTEVGPQKWKKFIEQLAYIEKKNIVALKKVDKGRNVLYRTVPVNGRALVLTGMDIVFSACQEKGLITFYRIPDEEDDLPAEFATDSKLVAQILEELVATSEREPLKHKYFLTECCKNGKEMQEGEKYYQIKDKTLYVDLCCENYSTTDLSGHGQWETRTLMEGLRILEKNGFEENSFRQNLIQNLQIKSTATGIQVSFKYASDAVKECLQKEENILKAMIYFKCLGMGIFDDLNINSEFTWCVDADDIFGKDEIKHKIDIIGTKDMKTYFISVGMQENEKEKIAKMKYYADYLGMDGQAIYVSSDVPEDTEYTEEIKPGEKEKWLRGIEYINRTSINEGILGTTIRKIVEKKEEINI